MGVAEFIAECVRDYIHAPVGKETDAMTLDELSRWMADKIEAEHVKPQLDDRADAYQHDAEHD